jgi:mono/diheme cytochrome c family protein
LRVRLIFARTLALVVVAFSTAALAQGSSSVWDGIYTEDQAAQGAAAFAAACASCHGAALTGTGEAPALQGAQFVSDFSGLTMDRLLDRIRTTMPQDNPGSLPREQYAAILAFLMKANGFPSGAKPLDQRGEYLTGIRFDAVNPHPAQHP